MGAGSCRFELEEERIVRWARGAGYRRILLQAPDGVKPCLGRLARALEGEGLEVVVSGSHAWGGCDVALREAEALGCDALVHIGHHGPVRFNPPSNVLFIPGRADLPLDEAAEVAARKLSSEGLRRVGVVSSVQHLHLLHRVLSTLADYGIEGVTARSPDPQMPEGLVIGCDARAAQRLAGSVDAFLVVSGGRFHALGVALATGAATFALDPYTSAVTDVGAEVKRVVARRLAHLSSVFDARDALIVASTKPGQWAGWAKLSELRRLLGERGVRSTVVVLDEVTREALEDLGPADVYVNTACPRLSTDDYHLFPAPVVNARELLLVLRGGLEAYEPASSIEP